MSSEANDLYQREPATGRATKGGIVNLMYPAIPEASRFQHHAGYGYQVPAEVYGWLWSETFGKWGARVRFEDGWTGLSWPEPESSAKEQAFSCRILRDAFFGDNREKVFKALPDLPESAFGATKCADLVPFAERLGLVPEGELVAPAGATHIVYNVGMLDLPWDGSFTEEIEPIPQGLELGGWSIKEHIVAKCVMTGARYGCCWFRRFI